MSYVVEENLDFLLLNLPDGLEDENRNQVIETLKYHLNEVFAHIFPIFGGNGGLCKALTRAPSSGNATNQIQQAHKVYQPNSNSRHPLTIDHFIPLI